MAARTGARTGLPPPKSGAFIHSAREGTWFTGAGYLLTGPLPPVSNGVEFVFSPTVPLCPPKGGIYRKKLYFDVFLKKKSENSVKIFLRK